MSTKPYQNIMEIIVLIMLIMQNFITCHLWE